MSSNEQYIWSFLKNKGFSDFGTSGLMGNLFAESGLNPINLQQTFEKKLGLTDLTYTQGVDTGSYTNFVKDSAGYGLAQWTYWSRKQKLLEYAKSLRVSIGDLDMQLNFLLQELQQSFPSVYNTLLSATSIEEASNAVLFDFERPANQGTEVQLKRQSYSKTYFNKYSNIGGNIMSNSPLVDYTLISPNKTSPRNKEIDTVTIHCYVGQVTVERMGKGFADPNRQASCNYGVAYDGKIGMYCEEKDRSWCSGGYKLVDGVKVPIRVNGISGSDNDHQAITIEVACESTHPYEVTPAAYEALINLLVDICTRNPKIGRLRWQGDKSLVGKVDQQNMTVHRWFANKACPGDYLYLRHGEIAAEVNRRLDNNTLIIDEDDNMDVVRFKELFDEMRGEFRDNDSASWSKEARDWAVNTGLINGNGKTINGEPNCMWEDLLTREQLAMVLYRFAQMIGKV